jgi:predicted RNase H-like HicB family nuclease
MSKVSVVIERDENGYYAFCPELEGCQSQGDSLEEVLDDIKEAIELHLKTLSEDEIEETIKELDPKEDPILQLIGIADVEPFSQDIDKELYG